MTAAKTGTRLGEQYRRIARRRGKQKAIVAVSRVICEIAWILISDPGARFTDPGPSYYRPRSPHARPGPRSVRSNGSTPA
jgi:transposase